MRNVLKHRSICFGSRGSLVRIQSPRPNSSVISSVVSIPYEDAARRWRSLGRAWVSRRRLTAGIRALLKRFGGHFDLLEWVATAGHLFTAPRPRAGRAERRDASRSIRCFPRGGSSGAQSDLSAVAGLGKKATDRHAGRLGGPVAGDAACPLAPDLKLRVPRSSIQTWDRRREPCRRRCPSEPPRPCGRERRGARGRSPARCQPRRTAEYPRPAPRPDQPSR